MCVCNIVTMAKLKSESVGVANGSYKEGLRKSKNVSNDGVEMVIQRCSSPQRPGGGGESLLTQLNWNWRVSTPLLF